MSPAASVSILQILPKHNLFNLGNNESCSFNVQVVDSYSVSFGLPAGPSNDLSAHTSPPHVSPHSLQIVQTYSSSPLPTSELIFTLEIVVPENYV